MRSIDFSSSQALLSTLFGLAVVTLIGVGIRLLFMQAIQRRRERDNRQINERLRTLIAAYKTLGGSFTGNLAVDPTHLRDLHAGRAVDPGIDEAADADHSIPRVSLGDLRPNADRARRVRDAVEAALSDIILLGTEEQVRLAAKAATELAAGRSVHTAELVVSLRSFIRQVLDLDPVPAHIAIPNQGPARPSSASRGKGEGGTTGDTKQHNVKGMGGGTSSGVGVGIPVEDEQEPRS